MDLADLIIPGLAKRQRLSIQDAIDIVQAPISHEHLRGEDGERLRLVGVSPIRDRYDHIQNHAKAEHNVNDGEPGCSQRGAKKPCYGRPVECEGADAEAEKAGTDLLHRDGVWPDPADEGEGSDGLEEEVGYNVVCKA